MNFFKIKKIEIEILPIIEKGGIGILPTDTLYGIVGSALDKRVVERIYEVRKRDPKKPCIILISRIEDIEKFGVEITKEQRKTLKNIWPGKISVILECNNKNFEYLSRGTGSLSFRVPKKNWLRRILEKTGPLVAPSANVESMPHSQTIEEAKKYFNDKVDFYIDYGKISSDPSKIIRLFSDGSQELIRK